MHLLLVIYIFDSEVKAVEAHPFVPGIVTVCDVGDRSRMVQSFGMLYQSPARKTNVVDADIPEESPGLSDA